LIKKLFQELTIMSTIAISVTEDQFEEHISPFLSKAQRGYVCSIPLHKVFNYMLYRLHTGCQWDQIPIEPDPTDATKKKSVGKPSTTMPPSGAGMAV
jgi:hypothetical protein